MSVLNVIITVIIVVLILQILKYYFADSNLLQDITNAKTASTISAKSLAKSGSSANFTYSTWFYINDWNYRYGEIKQIIGRMHGTSTNKDCTTGLIGCGPCPVIALDKSENNILVLLTCSDSGTAYVPPAATAECSNCTTPAKSIPQICTVENIPIQKWVNLIVSVYGRTLDIYLDGKLVKTQLLPGVPIINSDADIYVTPDAGFDGWTAKIQYFPNSFSPQDAWNIYSKGYAGWTNIFNSYQVQLALMENGNVQTSVTI